MIIDFHTHVFPPKIKNDREHFLRQDACFAELYSGKNSRLATAGELIAGMDAAGIDVSVIDNIAWSSPELSAETNDYIMESVARYPGRLVGFGHVHPMADWAQEEMWRCATGGIKGIGELRPDKNWLDPANKDAMERFSSSIKELGLILLLHSSEPVGHIYPGKGEAAPDLLYRFIERYSGLKIVLAHWGGGLPFYALMPEVQASLKDVFFDSAASPLVYRRQVYARVVSLVGGDKILFGSDYPLVTQERAVNEAKKTGLPRAARALFLGGNARRLLGLP